MLRFSNKLVRSQARQARRLFSGLGSFKEHQDNFLSGENAIYVEQMYQTWKSDRSAVHASWDAYFTNLSNGILSKDAFVTAPQAGAQAFDLSGQAGTKSSRKAGAHHDAHSNVYQEKLANMILRYRRRAHEVANIDPLNIQENKDKFRVKFNTVEESPETYSFTKEELNKPIQYFSHLKGFHESKKVWTPAETSQLLQEIYSGPISFEYMHIPQAEVSDWIRSRIEKVPAFKLSKEEKLNLLDRIIESQAFTDFCDKKYSSSKRFGIEGLDSAISGMEALVDAAKDQGVAHVILGMAHRGRLNTLSSVFDKPYEAIFTEFKDPGIQTSLKAAEWGFSGDVKYHLGASQQRIYPDGSKISMVK